MKKIFSLLTVSLVLSLSACSDHDNDEPDPGPEPAPVTTWHHIWTETFKGSELDATKWKKIEPYNPPSSGPDWRKYISTAPECFEFTGESVILKGINTPSSVDDSRPYICGGITTEGLVDFEPPFRIEIRARLSSAQGAWPAMWMMPSHNTLPWPDCGEIDIMEHLNHEGMVYQTVHSAYTSSNPTKPSYSFTQPVSTGLYNVYTIYVTETAVIWAINGSETFRYSRLSPEVNGQFPFFKEWYLKLDMQLGGSWVGYVDTAQLPVTMEIDWVKYYRYY